jgi:hypothetical protein
VLLLGVYIDDRFQRLVSVVFVDVLQAARITIHPMRVIFTRPLRIGVRIKCECIIVVFLFPKLYNSAVHSVIIATNLKFEIFELCIFLFPITKQAGKTVFVVLVFGK